VGVGVDQPDVLISMTPIDFIDMMNENTDFSYYAIHASDLQSSLFILSNRPNPASLKLLTKTFRK
jgi:hypothetical protein